LAVARHKRLGVAKQRKDCKHGTAGSAVVPRAVAPNKRKQVIERRLPIVGTRPLCRRRPPCSKIIPVVVCIGGD
jgi:hypothetical protein